MANKLVKKKETEEITQVEGEIKFFSGIPAEVKESVARA